MYKPCAELAKLHYSLFGKIKYLHNKLIRSNYHFLKIQRFAQRNCRFDICKNQSQIDYFR